MTGISTQNYCIFDSCEKVCRVRVVLGRHKSPQTSSKFAQAFLFGRWAVLALVFLVE